MTTCGNVRAVSTEGVRMWTVFIVILVVGVGLGQLATAVEEINTNPPVGWTKLIVAGFVFYFIWSVY